MKKPKFPKYKLDKEELELEKSIARGEWKSIANFDEEKEKLMRAAKSYLRKTKEKRICIRVFAEDLERIKSIAQHEGLPYQTLVTSVLHKFACGRLK